MEYGNPLNVMLKVSVTEDYIFCNYGNYNVKKISFWTIYFIPVCPGKEKYKNGRFRL